MLQLLDEFTGMSWPEAAAWLLAINAALFVLSVASGELLARLFRRRPVTPPPPPLAWREVGLALACVVLNAGVALAGWLLWRAGILRVRRDSGWLVALDVAVLLLAMDFLMYVTHRLAHVPRLFPLFHHIHHRHDYPRPLDLFIVHPAEVLGFGALWLGLLCLYPSSWEGILVYVALNLAFGTIGHAGVEPYPAAWSRRPVLRHLGSSTFHAGHHQDVGVNFGFYTQVWDRLFGTLGGRRSAPDVAPPAAAIEAPGVRAQKKGCSPRWVRADPER